MPKISVARLRLRAAIFLACLLLPVAFASLVYVSKAYEHIANMERERLGLQLIGAIDDAYFTGNGQRSPILDVLAKKTNVTIDDGLEKFMTAVKLQRLADLHVRATSNSGLILDDEFQTYYLISANLINLQRSFGHLAGASRASGKFMDAADEAQVGNYANLALSDLGQAKEFARLATEDLQIACNCEDRKEGIYAAQFVKLSEYFAQLDKIHSKGLAARNPATLLSDLNSKIGPDKIMGIAARIEEITRSGSGMIDAALKSRIAIDWRNILLTAFAGTCLTLFGTGYIFHGYRQNIQQMKELEQALQGSESARAATDAMNNEVAELNKSLANNLVALQKAQDEVVRKSRFEQMGQVTATIAHEIRNPLGAVRTSAFVVSRKVKPLNLGLDQQFDRINNGIARCDKIISQLLDYSRTKKIDADHHVFDAQLAKAIEEEGERLPPQIRIHAELGCGETEVPFDITRLRRAMANLLSNAAEALVGAQTVDPTIRIDSHIAEGFAVITVRDNGPGIAPENLARITEPLFTTKGFGTGLGLPAVQQIAEQHGGSLKVESDFGNGACFTITLALREKSANAAA